MSAVYVPATTPPMGAASTEPPLRVLVVDDQADIREPLADYLARQGLCVRAAADSTQARRLMRAHSFDVLVLDIMLPGENGLSLCREIALTLGTPTILLTAMAAPLERIEGLDSGADDYVIKPFDPQELMARIRSVLRRQRRGLTGIGTSRFGFEGWVLDVARRTLADPAGCDVPLSEAEWQLLAVLIRHPNKVLSRDQLLDLTRQGNLQVFDRSVDTQISRLRRKIEADPRRPSLIKTAWGNGYLFAAEVRPLSA